MAVVSRTMSHQSNADGMEKLTAAVRERKQGLIFCNLVDFDMLYGHRKDVEGFAKSLEEFDRCSAASCPNSAARSADDYRGHGCDPDPRWPTTDHSREHVPILAYSPALEAERTWAYAKRLRTWGRRSRRISVPRSARKKLSPRCHGGRRHGKRVSG